MLTRRPFSDLLVTCWPSRAVRDAPARRRAGVASMAYHRSPSAQATPTIQSRPPASPPKEEEEETATGGRSNYHHLGSWPRGCRRRTPRKPLPRAASRPSRKWQQQQQQQTPAVTVSTGAFAPPKTPEASWPTLDGRPAPELPESRESPGVGLRSAHRAATPGRLALLALWRPNIRRTGRVRFPQMSRAAARGPHGRGCLPKGIEGVAGGGSKKASGGR